MIQLPPHNHPKDERELREQLGIEERFPLALIALMAAAFVFAISAAIVAGLSFNHWRSFFGL